MKTWTERFFELNKINETELEGVQMEAVCRSLKELAWNLDDLFQTLDLSVSRWIRGDEEIFVIEETYFDPKLTGLAQHVDEVLTKTNKKQNRVGGGF